MDVRHEEFMAMADAFLGPDFNPVKLAEVEALQRALHRGQAKLAKALHEHRIERTRYVDELNALHAIIARQCEQVLGPRDFLTLFGITSTEASAGIDREEFLTQA